MEASLKRSMLGLGAGLFVLVVVLDWVTKILAEKHLAYAPIHLISDWASLRLAYNHGVAFSAFDGLPHWVLGGGALILLAVVLWGLRSLLDRPAGVVSLALVSAGGISNAIDRLLFGRVTDMISVWKWPVFNIADIAITVGVGLLLLISRKDSKEKSRAAVEAEIGPPSA